MKTEEELMEYLDLLGFKNDKLIEKLINVYLSEDPPHPYLDNITNKLITEKLNKNSIMLEFGAGFSTLYYPLLVKDYYSIESQIKWVLYLNNYMRCHNKDYSNVELYYVPIIKISSDIAILNYNISDIIIHNLDVKYFDVVLIDGITRERSIVVILPFIDNNSLVIFDNYNEQRYLYCHDIVEKYYEVIDLKTENGTVILKKLEKKK